MKKYSIYFLVLGLLFSQVIFATYTLNQGFKILSTNMKLAQAVDVALAQSSMKTLTTVFIGYFFFLLFSLINIKRGIQRGGKTFLIFLTLIVIALAYEITNMIEDASSTYQGKHMHIGLVLFVIGLFLLVRMYRKRTVEEKEENPNEED
ncbi:MAG: hypothetical protein Q8862_05100 [Bacteroidota bacterium]|nr:hypothetical protein [Bacteroidota bacterium]MDP4206467.1 hypothetical protein [Bacteroidota bacterium]